MNRLHRWGLWSLLLSATLTACFDEQDLIPSLPANTSYACTENTLEQERYLPVNWDAAPAYIRAYVADNYSGLTPALVLKELDDQEWEVYLKDNQRWRSIEFEGNNVVSNRLEGFYLPQTPAPLMACIQQSFPSANLQLAYRENDGDYTAYLLINNLVREISWMD